jgi:hypothetical protein
VLEATCFGAGDTVRARIGFEVNPCPR